MVGNYPVSGDSFVPEKPRVWIGKLGGTDWNLAPDGKHVVVLTPVDTPETPKAEPEVTFLFNFFDELRRRLPWTKDALIQPPLSLRATLFLVFPDSKTRCT